MICDKFRTALDFPIKIIIRFIVPPHLYNNCAPALCSWYIFLKYLKTSNCLCLDDIKDLVWLNFLVQFDAWTDYSRSMKTAIARVAELQTISSSPNPQKPPRTALLRWFASNMRCKGTPLFDFIVCPYYHVGYISYLINRVYTSNYPDGLLLFNYFIIKTKTYVEKVSQLWRHYLPFLVFMLLLLGLVLSVTTWL